MDAAKRSTLFTMGRYPVASVIMKGSDRPMQQLSLPDFEGVVHGGRQYIIEAKVCSQSSFKLSKEIIKPKQISHMLERSRYGVRCWVVIHFNERKLQTSHDPAETIAIPINDDHPFWQKFVDAYQLARQTKQKVEPQGSISRERAARIGTKVHWTFPPRARKFLPDLEALLGLKELESNLL